MIENLPLGIGVRVLARHPAGLLALDKPAGLVSHPNSHAGEKYSLLTSPYDLAHEYYKLENGRRLFLLNRIDSPTSGLVLAATTPELAVQIKKLLREHGSAIDKVYYAVVKGPRLPDHGIWRDKYTRYRDGKVLRARVDPNGVIAVSRYRWVDGVAAPVTPVALSLLRLVPETGRTHQLRVQCAFHGHPIVGDKTYGDFNLNRRLQRDSVSGAVDWGRLFLHSCSVAVNFTYRGRTERFEAVSPLPGSFLALFPRTAATPNLT